jgi:hypothetical protein
MARITIGSTRVYSGDPEEIRDPLDFFLRSQEYGVREGPDGARAASGLAPAASLRSGSPPTCTSALASQLGETVRNYIQRLVRES